MLINKFPSKDKYIVPERTPLIMLYKKYVVCISTNGKDTKHNTHMARRVHLVIKGEKRKNVKY